MLLSCYYLDGTDLFRFYTVFPYLKQDNPIAKLFENVRRKIYGNLKLEKERDKQGKNSCVNTRTK